MVSEQGFQKPWQAQHKTRFEQKQFSVLGVDLSSNLVLFLYAGSVFTLLVLEILFVWCPASVLGIVALKNPSFEQASQTMCSTWFSEQGFQTSETMCLHCFLNRLQTPCVYYIVSDQDFQRPCVYMVSGPVSFKSQDARTLKVPPK